MRNDMKSLIILCFSTFLATIAFSQLKEKKINISNELKEISGIGLYNDSILLAINDGGNKPVLYFLNLQGEIINRSLITNATNNDWEELHYDRSNQILYIGDFGNNLNTRKNLCIYKIQLDSIWKKDSLSSQKISFSYPDQNHFPPPAENLEFNCEAMYLSKDSIHLITKSYAEPWRGIAKVYSLPTVPGNYSATLKDSIFIGSKNWQNDAVTACDFTKGNLTILTYKKIMFFTDNSFNSHNSIYYFGNLKQREAICRLNDKTIIMAAEKHNVFGGPYLFYLTEKK